MNQEKELSQQEKENLTKAGFACSSEKVAVPTPEDCQYWRHKHLVAPTCVKKRGSHGVEL